MRNDLRKHQFFHLNYNPIQDGSASARLVNNKIYVLNSEEPDFSNSPEGVEPSVNDFLLS